MFTAKPFQLPMKNAAEHQDDRRFSRRSFIKGAAGVAASALIIDRFAGSSEAFRAYLPYDSIREIHTGHRYGIIEHHYPDWESAGEKFVFVRLKYPGGDWYTNIVDYYRWQSDVKFSEILSEYTSINVERHDHPQFVSLDDEHFFNYPFLFMTGHMEIRLSDVQVRRLREYFERGGFLHVEDCDIRLNRGRGALTPAIHNMVRQVFPDKKFETLDMSHPIYHTLYNHDDYMGGDKMIPGYSDSDKAIMVDDRVVVYFCPSDLNCAWEGRPCSPAGEEQRQWAFEQGMNVVAYALSR